LFDGIRRNVQNHVRLKQNSGKSVMRQKGTLCPIRVLTKSISFNGSEAPLPASGNV
jgi:hypothetical protein